MGQPENEVAENNERKQIPTPGNIDWPAWIQAGCSAALVIFTFFLAVYAYQQAEGTKAAVKLSQTSIDLSQIASSSGQKNIERTLLEMKAQSIAMQESAKSIQKSADAAIKQASISQQNLAEIEKQFRLSQRAWIGMYDLNTPKIEVGKPISLTIPYKNYGKTPAKMVAPTMVTEIINVGHPLLFEKEKEAKKTRMSYALLNPDEKNAFHCSFKNPNGDLIIVDKEFYEIINMGKVILYIHGIIEYKDIFDTQHWVRFCYYFDPKSQAWYSHRKYNDTDNN